MLSPGQLIRTRRRAHGITQFQLALRAGTTQAAISRLERDELSPTVATVGSLLAAMGEVAVLSSDRAEPAYDHEHMRAALARSPAERLELAIGWNRLAGQIAQAGASSHARANGASAGHQRSSPG
ncbi:MAG: helix-turn-helix domain-containing protein [Actinomycetota bacterium]|nr:helix-turn-helix domain-containing protein [Actinomycetota bacterium]